MNFKDVLLKYAQENDIVLDPQSTESQLGRVVDKKQPPLNLAQSPPMMYRAQVTGRCSLQFAGDTRNLKQWEKEWVLPQDSKSNQPSYQYKYEALASDYPKSLTHSIKLEFPYRVLTNSGQDNISRPVLTVHGIPFIPGSSIKGIFKRLIKSKPEDSADRDLISKYCGTEETPGILRFHGAYPIGNWSKQILDLVHPQQEKQVQNNISTSTSNLISFYQPEFIFEFSSINTDVDWQNVERILREALTGGLGGKTSTGYGFLGKPDYANADRELYKKALHISFQGQGVASTLLDREEPEFRPNMFKAALRGHMMRLLGGVCSDRRTVEERVDLLLGSTDTEGIIKLFWESTKEPDFQNTTPLTYTTEGILHISTARSKDLKFITKVLQFAYIMGGFGKSWRRVWHKTFYPNYKKFEIGCHWNCLDFQEILNVNSKDTLNSFLEKLHTICSNRLESRSPSPIATWREAWHPDRVAVYSKVVNNSRSDAVKLFHEPPFKYTPAIDGRNVGDDRPTFVSSVWHRMLPIGDGTYLEIVTVFHGDRTPWQNQLSPFIQTLVNKEFQLTWGNRPN